MGDQFFDLPTKGQRGKWSASVCVFPESSPENGPKAYERICRVEKGLKRSALSQSSDEAGISVERNIELSQSRKVKEKQPTYLFLDLWIWGFWDFDARYFQILKNIAF